MSWESELEGNRWIHTFKPPLCLSYRLLTGSSRERDQASIPSFLAQTLALHVSMGLPLGISLSPVRSTVPRVYKRPCVWVIFWVFHKNLIVITSGYVSKDTVRLLRRGSFSEHRIIRLCMGSRVEIVSSMEVLSVGQSLPDVSTYADIGIVL